MQVDKKLNFIVNITGIKNDFQVSKDFPKKLRTNSEQIGLIEIVLEQIKARNSYIAGCPSPKSYWKVIK